MSEWKTPDPAKRGVWEERGDRAPSPLLVYALGDTPAQCSAIPESHTRGQAGSDALAQGGNRVSLTFVYTVQKCGNCVRSAGVSPAFSLGGSSRFHLVAALVKDNRPGPRVRGPGLLCRCAAAQGQAVYWAMVRFRLSIISANVSCGSSESLTTLLRASLNSVTHSIQPTHSQGVEWLRESLQTAAL